MSSSGSHNLHTEIDSLRRRVQELDLKNRKLVSELSSCRCSKWEASDHGYLKLPNRQILEPKNNKVYKLSIGAACRLQWPSDKLIIQVLDDSTDPNTKQLVELECHKWANENLPIKYEIRQNRKGYKAGALREGLKKHYVKQCDYVTIFDADFQPYPDFLIKTVSYLLRDPELALVQARWKFVNSNECLMTRLQEMALDYHFSVEQEVGSSTHSFFGFNGTAGVWRLQALTNVGGWKDLTTVEDMDLAVRASLKGWKFVFAGDISVKNELPSTYKAYRFQQHRWSCGPANLFRKMFKEIIMCERVSIWKKFHVICVLLCSEDSGTYCDFLLLLHSDSGFCTRSRSSSAQVHRCLCSFHHYHSQCHMHYKHGCTCDG